MSGIDKGTVRKFLDFAKPDELGWTEIIRIDDLNTFYETTEFSTKNGGAWCRSDGALSKYNIERIKAKTINESGKACRRIVAIQLKGFKETDSNRGIRADIRQQIKLMSCAILQTSSDIQVDHKSPRLETTPEVLSNDTQSLGNFQALCRAANSAKRGHCRKCIDSGVRFDARLLGYSVAQWMGGERFAGNCVGCYWYDPVEFNRQVSAGFQTKPVQR